MGRIVAVVLVGLLVLAVGLGGCVAVVAGGVPTAGADCPMQFEPTTF